MANNLVVCGGTFDHFHKGHEAFLQFSLSLGKKVIIGITSDEFIKNRKQKLQNEKQIEPFDKRKKAVSDFIKTKKALKKTELIVIDDVLGPTLSKDLPIDVIVVSKESKNGADIINKKRKELNLSPLGIFISPLIMAEDDNVISSARIRKGEINRKGRLYINPLWLKKDLLLPEDLRDKLRKPFDEIVKEFRQSDGNSYIITVGDEASKRFNAGKINRNLSVVDFKTARKETYSSFSDLGFSGKELVVEEDNAAGRIQCNIFAKIQEVIRLGFTQKVILKIIGEEDLLVLPIILASPLNAVVYYGQPDGGLVRVLISESMKERAYDLALKFSLM